MDGRERAAAAHAAGGAVARVTRAVAGTHEAVTGVVRTGLTPLGPAGRLPFEASALMARINFAAVETAARGVGAGAAPLLEASAAPGTQPASERPPAVAWLAALGAAFGDQLVDDDRVRALTVPMSFRHRGAPVAFADAGPGSGAIVDPRPTVVVFVHGLGNHESVWGQSHLDVVDSHGATGLTVRYTTGQAIADSGAELAGLLGELVTTWPVAVERIVLVGHSMGGLVIREGLAAGGAWRERVSDVVTLGTPHAGAPLERVAVRGLALASAWPVIAPIAALGDERSTGIKDLGIADVADPVPGPDWHLVAATLGSGGSGGVLGRVRSGALGALGDGLVTLDSAFAVDERLTARRVVIDDASHMALLDHPEAAEHLGQVLRRR
ncbi:MAG: alpha/beta fold hydrolase [Candidatus Nanopelagicales bacterium]|jgi:pimeloyl-ACP methyl ester carboxylesterase|nr:alpha/beta fold hydrolase [Candidatus Nanopelagicales bacterium]